MRSFLEKIDKVILGGITVVIIFLLGFLWWIFSPQDTVPMWLFSLVIIIGYASCIVVYALSAKNTKVTYVLPKVKTIWRSESKIIFLLEKNELFSQGAYVTIAYQDDDDSIETTLGLGYVETINSQGNMQIVFQRIVDSSQVNEIILSLSDKKQSRNAIKIKPTVSKNYVEEDINSWGNF